MHEAVQPLNMDSVKPTKEICLHGVCASLWYASLILSNKYERDSIKQYCYIAIAPYLQQASIEEELSDWRPVTSSMLQELMLDLLFFIMVIWMRMQLG